MQTELITTFQDPQMVNMVSTQQVQQPTLYIEYSDLPQYGYFKDLQQKPLNASNY